MGAAALRGFPLAGEGEHDHPHSGEDSAQLAIVGPAQPSKKGIPMLRVCPRTLGPAHGSAALVCRPQSVDAVEAIVDCRQPVWMDSGALCAPDAIAPDWEQQKQRLLLGRAA